MIMIVLPPLLTLAAHPSTAIIGFAIAFALGG